MTAVAGGLITLEFALEGLNYKIQGPGADGELNARDQDVVAYIVAATPVIEHLVGPVQLVTKTQRFNGGKFGVLLVDGIADEAAVTSVLEDGTTTTDYVVDEDSGIVYAGSFDAKRRFSRGRKNITIVYQTGWETVPPTLQLATRELVKHWVQQSKQVPVATFDGVPADGGGGVPMGFAIPNRVAELCAPYRLVGGSS